jgi:hypothetical protein
MSDHDLSADTETSRYRESEHSIADVIDEIYARLRDDPRLRDDGRRCTFEHVGVMSLIVGDAIHDMMPDPWGRSR